MLVLIFLSLKKTCHSQNLLNTSSWTIGSGSVPGFSANGSSAENLRELGLDHVGNQIILWKAVPDANSDSDGGWDSNYYNIDNTKSYRFSVWIKKTNSYSGVSYFGCQKWSSAMDNHSVLGLNGNFYNNPYFWNNSNGNNQLPRLDRWYLLVGFIHHKNYTQTVNQGAIYDGVTGELVQNITDFKFSPNTTQIRHRAYLYYNTNTSNRQYFCKPRIDLVNGSMPSINKLLSINEGSKLMFAYDNSGNQKQRFYCAIGCSIPTPPAGRPYAENEESTESIVDVEELIDEDKKFEVILSPNPTKGVALIKLNSNSDISFSHDVNIYNNAGILIGIVTSDSKKELEIDLTNLPSGIYLVHIHLSNGKSITKQIIKN